jgi:glycerophosphoryl diester phosphodiesterase
MAALVGFLLLAGACGGDDGDEGASSSTTEPRSTSTAAEEVEVTAPSIDELLAAEGPLLLAHAGGDRDWPQETLYAYRQAAEAGTDVLEMDVMLTADDQLVVHHDETVDRLTSGTGAVAELTLEELRELDAAHWWSPECTNGSCRDLPGEEYPFRGIRTGEIEPPEGATPEDFRVPTFREVALAFPDLPLDVEVKGEGEQARAAADVLADELEELDRVDSTVVVSFDAATVEHVRTRLPEVTTSPGLSTMTDWILGGEPLGGYEVVQVPPSYEGIDLLQIVLDRAEAEGIRVWVWPDDADSQENADYYQQLIDAGVHGIIAGSPSVWPG